MSTNLKANEYHVKLTMTEALLGTTPLDTETFEGFTAADLPGELLDEEKATIPDGEGPARGLTGFHRAGGHSNGAPLIYDYVIKGFFKDACSMLRRVPGTNSAKLRAFKKIIDGLVFVKPRRIVLHLPHGQGPELEIMERPLRASTARGERITIARSEVCPAGTTLEFDVVVLSDELGAGRNAARSEDMLREWLEYGRLRGLGQWRNASWGTFTYEMTAA